MKGIYISLKDIGNITQLYKQRNIKIGLEIEDVLAQPYYFVV